MITPTLDELVALSERFDLYVDNELSFCRKRDDGTYSIISYSDYISQYDIVEIVDSYDNCLIGRSEQFGDFYMSLHRRVPVYINDGISEISS